MGTLNVWAGEDVWDGEYGGAQNPRAAHAAQEVRAEGAQRRFQGGILWQQLGRLTHCQQRRLGK